MDERGVWRAPFFSLVWNTSPFRDAFSPKAMEVIPTEAAKGTWYQILAVWTNAPPRFCKVHLQNKQRPFHGFENNDGILLNKPRQRRSSSSSGMFDFWDIGGMGMINWDCYCPKPNFFNRRYIKALLRTCFTSAIWKKNLCLSNWWSKYGIQMGWLCW